MAEKLSAMINIRRDDPDEIEAMFTLYRIVFHAVTVQCEQILFGVLVGMILKNIHP